MKTDAPGPWRCETYLKCWLFGIRDGLVRDHIDNCRFCKPIVYGDGKLFLTSLDEDIAQRVAERKARTRRRFLKGLAAASVLTVGGLALLSSPAGDSTTTSLVEQAEKRFELQLDQIYAVRGRDGIVAEIGRSKEAAIEAYRWIVLRRYSPLYDLVFAGVADPRSEAKMIAISEVSKLTASDAAPYLLVLRNTASSEADPDVRDYLLSLVSRFENG